MHKIRNFHEGRGTVGEWQGSGRIVAGNGRERHGMCESAFNTAGKRHGNGMVCVNRPLVYEYTAALQTHFTTH
jgi:hypothetical protein